MKATWNGATLAESDETAPGEHSRGVLHRQRPTRSARGRGRRATGPSRWTVSAIPTPRGFTRPRSRPTTTVYQRPSSKYLLAKCKLNASRFAMAWANRIPSDDPRRKEIASEQREVTQLAESVEHRLRSWAGLERSSREAGCHPSKSSRPATSWSPSRRTRLAASPSRRSTKTWARSTPSTPARASTSGRTIASAKARRWGSRLRSSVEARAHRTASADDPSPNWTRPTDRTLRWLRTSETHASGSLPCT